MSVDETVAEYTEAKTTARKGVDVYPIGDDVLYDHIFFSFVDVMGPDVYLIRVETYSCKSNPKLIHPFKMWTFRLSEGRRLKNQISCAKKLGTLNSGNGCYQSFQSLVFPFAV
jgi:hypothetical protein